jgi:hypothetical protein
MLCAICALVLAPPAPGDLNPLIAQYKGLKNLSFTVIHHGDCGPADRDNADRIYWTAGRFDIDAIAYRQYAPSGMAKLVCNDGQVTAFLNTGELAITPQDPPNAIAAWEARGGLLLDWLMDGKVWKQMVQPQEGVTLQFETGPLGTWHDQPVREIVMTHTAGTYQDKFLIFVSPAGDRLIGTQYDVGGKTIWTQFDGEVRNI